MKFKNHILMIIIFSLLLLLYNCTMVPGDNGTRDEKPPTELEELNAGLRYFSNKILEGYNDGDEIKKDLEKLGAWYSEYIIDNSLNYQYYYYDDVVFLENDIATADSADGDSSGSNPDGYTTNNQVQGVDEADIVKSDGTYIYFGYQNRIIVHDLNGTIKDSKTIEGSNIVDILFNNNTIVVISTSYGYYYYGSKPTTGLTTFTVDSEGLLTLSESKEINGYYQSARSIDNDVYIITSMYIDYSILWDTLWRYNDMYAGLTAEAYQQKAREEAKKIIPQWVEATYKNLFTNTPLAYENIIQLNRMQKLLDTTDDNENPFISPEISSFITIYSFNLSSGLSTINASGTFCSSGYYNLNTYVNSETIVIANNGWNITPTSWESTTFLYGFKIEAGVVNPYAIGSVEGYVLNQFSMDCKDGDLRIATSVRAQWDINENNVWTEVQQSNNMVTILRESNGEYTQIGRVSDLGKGERIYSVRYVGDTAYVVTFRETDPFYTIDLTDPVNPKLKGELKIPGFSNYLHPIDTTNILAIGRDADLSGSTGDIQIALFDVSDLNNPVQRYKYVIPSDTWSSSEATWDHHAFRYVPSKQLLIIPFKSYDYTNYYYRINEGFKLFSILPTEGINPYGEINYDNAYVTHYSYYYYNYMSPRSLVFSDQIVTLMGHQIASHDYQTLTKQWCTQLYADIIEQPDTSSDVIPITTFVD